MKVSATSLYMHFPFCRHLCNYCDFYKKKRESLEDYSFFHQYLEDSVAPHNRLLEETGHEMGELETFFIGGGTPSLWGLSGAGFLSEFFKTQSIIQDPTGEHTMEVNPGGWEDESIQAFKELGMNRFSVGLQSLNSNYLKILDRIHNIEESHRTLEYFQKNNFSFSVDFMLGLPELKQVRDIEKELKSVLEYNPEHLSLYILTVPKQYPHYDKIPVEEKVGEEYLFVANYLKERGYIHYEVSNFALPGKESRHNLKYWKSETVLALGPSATGLLPTKGKSVRYKWLPTKPEFHLESLGEKELNLEKVYLRLRIRDGIEKSELEFFANKDLTSVIAKWQEGGYLLQNGHLIQLNSQGFLMMDQLFRDIL